MQQHQEAGELPTQATFRLESSLEVDQRQQTAAQQAAPSESIETILAVVSGAGRKRLRQTRQYQALGMGIVGGFAILALIDWALTRKFPEQILTGLGGMAGLIGLSAATSGTEKEATRSLAQFEDVRSVGPLAVALTSEDKQIRLIAQKALLRLLPLLTPNDSNLLTTEQRQCLHLRLALGSHGFSLDLAVAILQAFEKVGDARELELVQRIAHGKGGTEAEKRLQKAAQESLPFVQARVREQAERRSLLRPSRSLEAPSDHLLRPHGPSGSAEL